MRKAQWTALIWTLFLAIPFTALALALTAYTTDHLTAIATWIASAGQIPAATGRPWIMEAAERYPEIAGMIAGQVIILIILLVTRMTNNHREENNS